MLKKYTYLCIYYNPLKFSSYERDNILLQMDLQTKLNYKHDGIQ